MPLDSVSNNMARSQKGRSTSKKSIGRISRQSRVGTPFSSSKHTRNNRKTSKRSLSKQKQISLYDKLVLYLNDALSMENASMERLQSRIKQTKMQDSKQQLQHHLDETKEQQNRLKQLILNLGGKPTKDKTQLPIPSLPKTLLNIVKKYMTSAEIELKGTKEDAIVENAEIVIYDLLIQLLHEAKVEEDAESILTQSLNEEKSMAEWIKSTTPTMLTQLWPDIEASVTKKQMHDEEK
jgi:ferritin-like metal-binding protein YciE